MSSPSSPESSYSSPEITLDDITDTLSLMMSRDAAAALVQQCLREANVEDIDTVSGLLGFADKLIAQGGWVRTVGSGLRRSAALRPSANAA